MTSPLEKKGNDLWYQVVLHERAGSQHCVSALRGARGGTF